MGTEENLTTTAVRVRLTGRVQGVGLRNATQDHAEQVGCRGWVRNLPGGSVEAWLEGGADAVQAMLDWLRDDPGWARIEHCTVESRQAEGHQGFRIVR